MTQTMMHTTQRDKNTNQKAVRLVWLWMMQQMAIPTTPAAYARRFGIDPGNASRDIRIDLPAVSRGIEDHFPKLAKALSYLFNLTWLDNLPLTWDNAQAQESEVTVTFTVNHQTGEIRWQAFTQKLLADGETVAEIPVAEGSNLEPFLVS